MHYMEELKDMLCKELEEIAGRGELSAGSLETVHKLTDTIKNIGKIEMLEGEGGYSQDDGYSQDGDWQASGVYGRHHSYDDDSSYARHRKRDSMGRYSRDGGYSEARRGTHYVRGHYSRNDAKTHMVEQLEEMMENAETSKEKEAIKRCIHTLQNA